MPKCWTDLLSHGNPVAPTQLGSGGNFQLKNWMVCEREMWACQPSVQEMESRRTQEIYGKIWRNALRTGKETAHGASLDDTSHQKEERVSKFTIMVMPWLFLLLVFTPQHWRLGLVVPESQHEAHLLSRFLFFPVGCFLTTWVVTRG